MTDLVPCPLCGGSEGYEVTTDIGWNAAGAYAEGLRREAKRLCESRVLHAKLGELIK